MTHKIGQTTVRWTLSEIENLDYFYEEFNDKTVLDDWREIYGYDFRSGLQADFRSAQPDWVKIIVQDMAQQGINLDTVGTSFYKMRPGDFLPRHQDTYARYCAFHQVQPSQVWRAIIFLQPWQPGFIFEIDDTSITGYADGTYVLWHNDTPHMAGNLGRISRYTLQITGVMT